MQLNLFTSNDKFRSEIYIVIKLLENGLQSLQIKKPDFTKKQLRSYIDQIPEKFHNKLIIHSHYNLIFKYNLKGIHISKHFRNKKIKFKTLLFLIKYFRKGKIISCSCHNIDKLLDIPKFYTNVFISPIFTKENNLNPLFPLKTLENIIPQLESKVFATGGIILKNVDLIKNVGFEGVGLMGSIWFDDAKQPLLHFKESKEKLTTLS